MSDDTGNEGAVGASRGAIINGLAATMENTGALVRLNLPGGGLCSGALLSDTWVLSARHCIPNAHLATPPSNPPNITVKNLNDVSRNVAEAFYMPGEYIVDEDGDTESYDTDVVLLRLNSPFPLDFRPAFSTAINYLYPFANYGLEGGYLRCAGFGRRALGGSSGKASYAFLDVEAAFRDRIDLIPNEDGQIEAPGDSGGPCTVNTATSVPFQARVTNGSAVQTNEAGELIAIFDSRGAGAQGFRDWALGIMNIGVGLYSDRNFKGSAQTVANTTLTLPRVGDRETSSIRVPPGWQARLWDAAPGFGNSITVTGNLKDMPTGWNDRVVTVEVLQNGVQIFRDPSFTGSTRTLAPGRYDAVDLGTLFNNQISSLRVPSDWRVRVFFEAGFLGAEREFYGSTIGSLGSGVNDNISSLVVEQPVTVFSEDFYLGEYQIFWEGPYNHTDMRVPDQDISSIVVPAGFVVEAFDGEDQTGASMTITSSQIWMPEGWNDRIRSLRVRRAR